jgi:ABC-type nitrate/sulfonate/bicarbonate transport system ATPase subunit
VADHIRTGSIVLERVTQRFPVPREDREFTAVQDVSLDVRGGEFVSIVGPSGCGKSTLLSLIAGLVPVTAGRIAIDGQAVAGVNPRLGFVFQRDAIFPWKTVAQNVGLPLLFRGVDAASARSRVADWIARIGLTGFEQYHPFQLSGGMRKRVALAIYAESFEHAREAFPPDSLVSRDGGARVIETMRAFDVVPAGMKFEPESVYDNRFVLKALGR